MDTESFSGDYTITGILDTTGQEKQNIYSFLISKEMLKQCTKYEPDGYFAYVHLNHVDQLDGELIKSDIQKIKEELQIPGVGFHDAYFRYYAYCKKRRTFSGVERYVYRNFAWFRSDTFAISQRIFSFRLSSGDWRYGIHLLDHDLSVYPKACEISRKYLTS